MIRQARAADIDWLVELMNLPAVAGSVARSGARTRAGIAEQVQAGERWILLGEDGERVGTAGLRMRVRRVGLGDLYGVAIHPDARGRGLARRGLTALVDHAFDVLGYHRLELEAYGYNDAAIALFRSMGFVDEGVRRQAWRRFGEWQDGIRFGVLADDR